MFYYGKVGDVALYSDRCIWCFRNLSSLKDQRAGSHLSRLLLRIDFNQFVSRGV